MQTKEKILWAAVEQFAEHGYHATTMRGIAHRAQVNHAAINYYFQSKEQLYKNVLLLLLEHSNLHTTKEREIHNQHEWRAAIFDWIYQVMRSMHNSDPSINTYKNSIFFRELCEHSGQFAEVFHEHIRPIVAPLIHYISLGLGEDEAEKQLDLLLFSVIAQFVFYAHNKLLITLLSDRRFDLECEENIRQIAAIMTEQLCSCLSFQKHKLLARE